MVHSIDAAFHDREVALNRIGMHGAAHIFADAVVNRVMPVELASGLFHRATLIGVDVARSVQLRFKDGGQRFGGDLRNVMRTNATTTLYKGHHGFFAYATRAGMLALAPMLVFLQTAHKGFVYFNGL